MSVREIGELAGEALRRYARPAVPRLPVAVLCADQNPWDASVLCELPDGHSSAVLHEGHLDDGHRTRWADRCHFPGDSCPAGTHPEEPA